MRQYLNEVADQIRQGGGSTDIQIRHGDPSETIGDLARSGSIDAVVMTAPGGMPWPQWMTSNVTSRVIFQTTPPIILVRPAEDWRSRRTRFKRLLVTLDGSETAEQVLPFVREIARRFNSDVVLLSVPEGADSDGMSEKFLQYLHRLKSSFDDNGISATITVEGSAPAQTIVRVAAAERADLIMMVSHGRGGIERQAFVKLGSVPDRVIQEAPCPVFLVSAQPSKAPGAQNL
jgi:nucleotide-binding universal stress UspA family protein